MMTEPAERRGGRPRKREQGTPREYVGFPIPARVKRELEAAAKNNGRSQATESASRLIGSFEKQQLLFEALSLTFGPQVAGVILMLGSGMSTAGRRCAAAEAGSFAAADMWMGSAYAVDQAIKCAAYILDGFRPGPAHVPQVAGAWLGAPPEHVGETIGFFTLTAAKEPDQINRGLPKEQQNPDREQFFRQIRALLGDAAADIRTPSRVGCEDEVAGLLGDLSRVRDPAKRVAFVQRLHDLRIDVRDAADD